MSEYVNSTYKIEYQIENNEASIISFNGSVSELIVPEAFYDDKKGESYRVTKIQKKSFLGIKGLRSIELPSGIKEVSDWAFSKCIHLNNIRFTSKPVFGKAVFEGCERLEKIYVNAKDINASEEDENLAYLLASVVNKFDAGYLLRDDDIGTCEWYRRWDLALKNYLLAEDIDGYDDRALCGEEDISYDGISSVDGELLGDSGDYLNEVGKNKCYLCILRLIHDTNLSINDQDLLKKYILARSYEKERPLAWKMLKEDAGENIELFEKYIEITNPSKDILEKMIKDISADKANVRAYLIKCSKKDENKEDDFFSQLLL